MTGTNCEFRCQPRVIVMGEDNLRSIGAILGLVLGIGLMTLLGYTGMVAGAIFGAGGCVLGAITAEKIFAWNQRKDR